MLITTQAPRRFHAKLPPPPTIKPSPSVRFRDTTTILSTPVITAAAAAAVTGAVGGSFLAATGMAIAGAVVGGLVGGSIAPGLQKGLGFLSGATRIHPDDRNLVTATGIVLGGLGGVAGAVAGSFGAGPVGVAASALAVGGTLVAGVRLMEHLDD